MLAKEEEQRIEAEAEIERLQQVIEDANAEAERL